MKIGGVSYRSIWVNDNGWSVHIFDQRKLPWELDVVELKTPQDAAVAIKEMWTRGAPLLAMTGAYGLALALKEDRPMTIWNHLTLCYWPPGQRR